MLVCQLKLFTIIFCFLSNFPFSLAFKEYTCNSPLYDEFPSSSAQTIQSLFQFHLFLALLNVSEWTVFWRLVWTAVPYYEGWGTKRTEKKNFNHFSLVSFWSIFFTLLVCNVKQCKLFGFFLRNATCSLPSIEAIWRIWLITHINSA